MILVAHIPHTMSLRSPLLLRALANPHALNIAFLGKSTSAYRELIHGLLKLSVLLSLNLH